MYIPDENNIITKEKRISLACEQAHCIAKSRAAKKNKKSHFKLNIGVKVLVKALNVSDTENGRIAKFFDIFEGPYEIVNKVGLDTYTLIDINTNKQRGKFHINNLKPYFE